MGCKCKGACGAGQTPASAVITTREVVEQLIGKEDLMGVVSMVVKIARDRGIKVKGGIKNKVSAILDAPAERMFFVVASTICGAISSIGFHRAMASTLKRYANPRALKAFLAKMPLSRAILTTIEGLRGGPRAYLRPLQEPLCEVEHVPLSAWPPRESLRMIRKMRAAQKAAKGQRRKAGA